MQHQQDQHQAGGKEGRQLAPQGHDCIGSMQPEHIIVPGEQPAHGNKAAKQIHHIDRMVEGLLGMDGQAGTDGRKHRSQGIVDEVDQHTGAQ